MHAHLPSTYHMPHAPPGEDTHNTIPRSPSFHIPHIPHTTYHTHQVKIRAAAGIPTISGVSTWGMAREKRTSEFVGVSWENRRKPWKASIDFEGKRKFLGYFDDEKDAARKYDEHAALEGKPVNFPQHAGQTQAKKRPPLAATGEIGHGNREDIRNAASASASASCRASARLASSSAGAVSVS